jgi:hypothetical protein
MFNRKFVAYFIVLSLPMLIVSILLNLVYSLNVHDYIQINWFIVILLAIVLDAFITWMHTRGKKDNHS